MDLRRRLGLALIVLVVTTAAAVAGYRIMGGTSVSLLDAVYMAVITLAGVGYGEFVDTSGVPALRLFNIFVVVIGVAVTLYVFSVVTAFLVEGDISRIFWRRKMLKRIGELKEHYIVCGLGDTGRHVVEELQKTGTPYVVIEHQEEHAKHFLEHHGDAFGDMLYLLGDATDEAVLDAAGIERARGLIAALPFEKENLVITVMARQKNAGLRIVARCTDLKFSERILKAGANATVSPDHIGGLRLASEVLRPHVVSFLDIMLKEQSRTLRIEEIAVEGTSPWVGKKIVQLNLRADYNLLPLAIRTADGEGPQFVPNPADDRKVRSGDVIIVMGGMDDVRRAREAARAGTPLAS
ncbi:MAG TPA: potassium channel protein [Terriglobales bacterium]|nr:potassium channel protein [Terriglobales bacterium]